MKLTHIHLFLILLAALVLCSFLGGVGCTREGMEDGSDDAEDNGDDNEDNENETNNDEEVKIVLVNKNGKISGSIQDNNYDNYYSGSGSVNTYYGPYGNKVVAVKGPYGNEILVDADYNQNPNYSQTTYTNGANSATATSGPQGNTMVTTSNNNGALVSSNEVNSVNATTGPQGNTIVTTSNNNGALVSTNGVKQIPHGDQDLYILKSQIVPPVCPACPGITPASLNGSDDVDVGDTSNTTTTITGPKGTKTLKPLVDLVIVHVPLVMTKNNVLLVPLVHVVPNLHLIAKKFHPINKVQAMLIYLDQYYPTLVHLVCK